MMRNRIASYALQAVSYAAFAAFVGYFSTSPSYEHLPPGRAVVKLSFQHAGERRSACRERTAEELAKLAPNMRAPTVCPRERSDVVAEITMDGQPLFGVVAPPTGLSKDGASTVYRRIAVPAGEHRFTARMADGPDGRFRHVADRTVRLEPGHVLVIDFEGKSGGWTFKGV
jgi:hypothetical protein